MPAHTVGCWRMSLAPQGLAVTLARAGRHHDPGLLDLQNDWAPDVPVGEVVLVPPSKVARPHLHRRVRGLVLLLPTDACQW